MSISGWDIRMLFRISLVSLDGPFVESELLGGGERVWAVDGRF